MDLRVGSGHCQTGCDGNIVWIQTSFYLRATPARLHMVGSSKIKRNIPNWKPKRMIE